MIAQLPSELLSLQLPLRIRIGDAQAFDLGPDPQVTMVIRDPSLLTEITHPSLDALGKAYVEKRLDIEGPISQVIGIGDALSEALGEPDGGAPPVRESHDKDTDAEAIHYHYDLSNDFYQLWLDPEMVYSCAYFETGKEDLATAQLAKLRHLCRKLRLQPGEKLLDVGCGWGAGAPGRSRVRRRGHRHHIEQGAAGARPGASQGRRPGGPSHPQAAGLPRPAARWPLRQGGQRRHVRARRARQPGAVLPATVRCGASRRPGDEPRHHLALHRRPPGWQGGPATSSIATCFPTASCLTCRWRWRG